ncbi:MAG: ABC transporter ATP-binding protein, partial [Symploca sp. SIO1C4]|nr:ABC transporter ATP-binding protein [Symploca sp. SIO1C4]
MKIRQSSPKLLRRLTRLWQENYIFWRELKYFPKIVTLAFISSVFASAFEGIGIGIILSFLQSLIYPNASAIQIGIDWVDIWVLGINEPATTRLYRLSAVIILITGLRSGFIYIRGFCLGMSQALLIDRLRQRVFEQFQQLSLIYFSKTRSG